jgi:hypothetical protein
VTVFHQNEAKPSLPGNARPYEQARQEKEHRHEETVGGEHDHVETDPRLGIGVTEIGIGDDGMVDEHHQRQEGAGAIDRGVSYLGLWRGPSFHEF